MTATADMTGLELGATVDVQSVAGGTRGWLRGASAQCVWIEMPKVTKPGERITQHVRFPWHAIVSIVSPAGDDPEKVWTDAELAQQMARGGKPGGALIRGRDVH